MVFKIMRAFLVAAVIAAMVVPVGAAQPIAPALELTYATATLSGWMEGNADLKVVEYAPDASIETPVQYNLTAAKVGMKNPEDLVVMTNAGVATSTKSVVNSATYYNAHIEGASKNRDSYLAISPVPGQSAPQVQTAGRCAELSALEPAAWAPPYYAAKRENDAVFHMETGLNAPVLLGACEQLLQVTIAGTFLLTNWEWDNYASGRDDEDREVQQVSHASGYTWETNVADRAGHGTLTQNFFEVHNGNLVITTKAHLWPRIIVGDLQLEGQDLAVGGDRLQARAVGTTIEIPAGEFVAEGFNTFTTHWRTASAVRVDVTGQAVPPVEPITPAARVTLAETNGDPAPQAIMADAPGKASAWPPEWMVYTAIGLFSLVVVLVYWFALLSGRNAEWHGARATFLARDGRALQALRHASAAALRDPGRGDVKIARALAYAAWGYNSRALHQLSGHGHKLPPNLPDDVQAAMASCAAKAGEPCAVDHECGADAEYSVAGPIHVNPIDSFACHLASGPHG